MTQFALINVIKSQNSAVLYGLAAVLCWSTVATAFKLSLNYITPLQLILLASLVSWLFLITTLLLQGRARALFGLSKKDYAWSFIFGLMNPALYYLLLFSAYHALPAQEAQALNYSWAIVMTLLAVPLLGQRLSRFDLAAAALCYFGVLMIATRGDVLGLNFANIKGVALALASTVVWSLYWILNQKDQRQPIVGLCLNFSFALPIIIIAAYITGDLGSLFNSPWQALMGGFYVGVFEMGLAFILWLKAMKLAENTAKIANLIFISPFLSLIFISVLLDEVILPSTLFGLCLIIAGLVVQQLFAKPKETVRA
ncbi:MAG: drug/metabolite transporter (DMT)-like permease [Arenicella sp.]